MVENLEPGRDRQRAIECLEYLCELHGFEKIKRLVSRTVIIAQDWVDEETFTILREHLQRYAYKAIYVYSSNIVAYTAQEYSTNKAMKILRNIANLNPDVAIHTDMVFCEVGYRPKSAFYFHRDSHEPANVMSIIMPTTTLSSYHIEILLMGVSIAIGVLSSVYISQSTNNKQSSDQIEALDADSGTDLLRCTIS